VALARIVFSDLDIMLLDEPARGIDVGSKQEIFALLKEAAEGDEESGIKAKGILMVSSYFPELIEICDRIIVIAKGRLVAEYKANECTEETLMLKAVMA
jgi:ribose transport system ATP-binding protein